MCNKFNQFIFLLFIIIIINLSCITNGFAYRERPVEPIYLEAQVGSHVIFDCELDFPTERPITYILNWEKDKNKIFLWYNGVLYASPSYLGRVSLVDNNPKYGKASMNLTAIRESDYGWYECSLIFPNRTPSTNKNGTWFHLSIDGGALIKIPPINSTVLEGEKAVLQCVMKYPDISVVTWYKDGVSILDMNDLSNRAFIDNGGSLVITTTIMGDLGEYECIVNSSGEQQSAKAYLNVQYKAKVVYAPPEVFFSVGKPGILNCHFRANPALQTLRWEKDGFLYEASNVPGVYLQRNGSLFFSTVDDSHAGAYSCIPTNELGSDGPSPLIRVIVQHPPKFTVTPKSSYFAHIGDPVTFHCDAEDRSPKHRLLITWVKKDGTMLPFNRITQDAGNITIENVTSSDRGIYQCQAQNEAATISAETELILANVPPHPPYNLTAVSNDTSITIHWTPGTNSFSFNHVLWYRLVDSQEWRTVKAQHRSNTEATASYLEPGREYELMVLSKNYRDDGLFSRRIRFYTKPNNFSDPEQMKEVQGFESFIQVGPPRNITVEEVDEGYLVKWVSPIFGQDRLKIFMLRWYLEPEHKLIGVTETTGNYYIVHNLEEDEVYTFQVFAVGEDNYEAPSEPFEYYIPPMKRKKVIAIGTITGLLFIIIAVTVFLISKRKWFSTYRSTDDTNVKI